VGRCDPVAAGTPCGTGMICSAGACLSPIYLTTGGTVTASTQGNPPEDMTQAFDQDLGTKWYAGGSATPWIAYRLPGTTTRVITSYSVGSANDQPDRDPKSWVLEGSPDGTTWTAVDTQTNQTFPMRRQLISYKTTSTTAYNRYRFRITANGGSTATQLSEIQLFGY
jgi:hypothetical protein